MNPNACGISYIATTKVSFGGIHADERSAEGIARHPPTCRRRRTGPAKCWRKPMRPQRRRQTGNPLDPSGMKDHLTPVTCSVVSTRSTDTVGVGGGGGGGSPSVRVVNRSTAQDRLRVSRSAVVVVVMPPPWFAQLWKGGRATEEKKVFLTMSTEKFFSSLWHVLSPLVHSRHKALVIIS